MQFNITFRMVEIIATIRKQVIVEKELLIQQLLFQLQPYLYNNRKNHIPYDIHAMRHNEGK